MRFAVLASVVFAAIAAAAPSPGGGTANACQGGQTYCCNNWTQPVDNSTGNPVSVPINVIAELQCTPVTILGIILGSTCSSSTVCCQNMSTNGLVNVQCLGIAL